MTTKTRAPGKTDSKKHPRKQENYPETPAGLIAALRYALQVKKSLDALDGMSKLDNRINGAIERMKKLALKQGADIAAQQVNMHDFTVTLRLVKSVGRELAKYFEASAKGSFENFDRVCADVRRDAPEVLKAETATIVVLQDNLRAAMENGKFHDVVEAYNRLHGKAMDLDMQHRKSVRYEFHVKKMAEQANTAGNEIIKLLQEFEDAA